MALLFLSPPAFAAEVFFGTNNLEVGVGKVFEVGVFMSTQGEDVNALEGRIVFPEKLLALREIRDGSSLVSLWVTRPKEGATSGDTGSVQFSGVIPSGYTGNQGYLFSLIFMAEGEGRAALDASDVHMFLHDGKGTEAVFTHAPLTILISEDAAHEDDVLPGDPEPPDLFFPEVVKDPLVFDGKLFLVFAAQDKGSGILRYHVQESSRNEVDGALWIDAESPYLLTDQERKSTIFVKAIDRAGNERIAVIPPEHTPLRFKKYLFWFILLSITVLVVYAGRNRAWKKYLKISK